MPSVGTTPFSFSAFARSMSFAFSASVTSLPSNCFAMICFLLFEIRFVFEIWKGRRHAPPYFCDMRLSSLSLRGAKRRGNLTQAITISPGVSSDPTGYCEIATAPLGPRNDKPLVFTILTAVRLLRRCSAGRGMPRPYGGCIMLYYLKKPFLTVSKISSAFLPQVSSILRQ